jgi:predicted DNA-binding transcriptional regulator AlpA
MIREAQRSTMPVDELPPDSGRDAVPRVLLSAPDAARALGISERTLWGLTKPRGPVPSMRVGGRVLYLTSALRAWAEAEHAQQNRTEAENV